MKKAFKNKYCLCLLSISLLLFIMNCGGDDPSEPDQTPQEIAEALFTGTWNLNAGSITLDGVDVTDDYLGFTLNVMVGTYSTTNAGELFPASGTWSWVGTSDAQVTTGSGKEITLSTLSETNLVIQFLKTNANARVGIPGLYVINLSK